MYLGIDLGTSSVKTVLMDDNQHIVASCSASMEVSRPDTGWSEQDPAAWVGGMESTLGELKANHPTLMQAVRGIGLSGIFYFLDSQLRSLPGRQNMNRTFSNMSPKCYYPKTTRASG